LVDGIYGPRTTAVVREFQRRAGLQVDGIAGPQTLGRLGLNFDQPPPLPTDRPFFYCASGTWATPFQGAPFDVGWRVEQMGLVRNQPVGYPAAGFLFPNLMRYAGRLEVVGHIGSHSVTVAGERAALKDLVTQLNQLGIEVRMVPVSIPSHFAYIEPLR
jgi:hypothetical protein